MGVPKEELKDRMSYEEFVEHRVDYEMQPWGDDWVQTDMILRAILHAPHTEFIPRQRIPVSPLSKEALARKVVAMFGIDTEDANNASQ